MPIAGKDLKTGQTLLKTVIAPMLKARMLGLNGWFSTNILGNRDGEVLDDPSSFKTKEESKLSVLDYDTSAGALSEIIFEILSSGDESIIIRREATTKRVGTT